MASGNRPTVQELQQALRDELGFRSRQMPVVMAEQILRFGSFVGSVIECHDNLDRAMNRARTIINGVEVKGGSVASGTVILADTMRGSKGRFDRVWHAPEGGVWGCLLHADTLLPQSRGFIPMAVGLSCCQAIHVVGGTSATLRWVNDVLIDGKKVAGFLVESTVGPVYGELYNLVGFGININNSTFPPELSDIAVSLCEVLGGDVDIQAFTTLFLAKLAWNFGIIHYEEARGLGGDGFSGAQGTHLLLDNWLHFSDTVGKRVRYGFDVFTNPQYDARVLGLEPDGGLRMSLDDGSTIVEHSGEIRYL
ncbi:biotin--[acetyl-CoA-carboxylase] ligase [Desulfopila sp. IMCC35008]|uniref:biotin--[acetyl-CoA-carboxylase] ligase n=1 Tax=Desulfopila sp. IMCC35008 TaxID=2653858 RepID=UPI0013CF9399|nr:biotin--[acetyl-CoA-carboxylase] ligase [Desulfopila sp. IMCC35008]